MDAAGNRAVFAFAPDSDDADALGDRNSVDGDAHYHVKKRRREALDIVAVAVYWEVGMFLGTARGLRLLLLWRRVKTCPSGA